MSADKPTATEALNTPLKTPYFMIHEDKLLRNLEICKQLKDLSGVKLVLALKCFSTWGTFGTISKYLDGTTSSGPYEVQLGHDTFPGETHAYSVGYSEDDVIAVRDIADKIIFNSVSQFERMQSLLPASSSVGLRINPEVSYAGQDLADPARAYSRLGVKQAGLTTETVAKLDGLMFHMNCENKDFVAYNTILNTISEQFSAHLDQVSWVSLGGGLFFTYPGYPVAELALALKAFAEKHQVQLYLEPGEAVITDTTDLVVSVLDVVENDKKTAIVDSATEAHRLDTLIYNEPASFAEATEDGQHPYIIGSCSCLAGDIFGEANFPQALQVGDRLTIKDSAGYTMVKLNWFNGLKMPSIYYKRVGSDGVDGKHVEGKIETLNQFDYQDFKATLGQD